MVTDRTSRGSTRLSLVHWATAGAMLAMLALLGSEVRAQSREVVELFERGLEAYRAGRYEEAVTLFSDAHAIEPVADLTYNRARALENLGRAGDAADAYELYLEENPTVPDRPGIERRIEALRARALEAQRLEQRASHVAEVAPPQTEERSSGPGPWPWIVGGSGVVVAGAGGVLAGLARAAHDRAASPDARQPDSLADEREANDLAVVANVLFAAGGAIFAGGLLWLLVAIAADDDSVSVSSRGVAISF
jgi:tetratricopeptide (TPR) repeat protein